MSFPRRTRALPKTNEAGHSSSGFLYTYLYCTCPVEVRKCGPRLFFGAFSPPSRVLNFRGSTLIDIPTPAVARRPLERERKWNEHVDWSPMMTHFIIILLALPPSGIVENYREQCRRLVFVYTEYSPTTS